MVSWAIISIISLKASRAMIPYFHALFIQRHGVISALMIYGRKIGDSNQLLSSAYHC